MNVQMVLPSVCAGGTTVPGAKKAEQEEADFWQLCLAMLGSGLRSRQTLVGRPTAGSKRRGRAGGGSGCCCGGSTSFPRSGQYGSG